MSGTRTQRQVDADQIDRALYRQLVKVQWMAESIDTPSRIRLQAAMAHIRDARTEVRMLMHQDDKEITP